MKLTLLFALLLVNATVAFMAPGVTEALNFKQQRNQRNPLQQKCRYNSCNMGNTKTKARISHVRYAADPAKNAKGDALPVMTESQLQEHNDDLDEEKFADGKLNGSYLILGILLITFASNQWSRQALYYLCDFSSNADPFKHINAAVGFDKEQYASLASFGFTIIFAVVSLFAGGVSDRYDRNVVTALSCGVWSIATAVQGFATGFNELIPLRAVIGASQAFFNPAAYTLLSEIFPKKIIGSINGIFSSGVYLGGGLASLSIILDSSIGWRNTLFVIGGLGVVISGMCYFLVTEPRAVIRKEKEKDDEMKENSNILSSSLTTTVPATVDAQSVTDIVSSAITSLKEVLESNEARLLFFASVLRFCAGFSIAIWKAPFVFAKFPENASSFAGSNAVIVALGGLVSSLIGGVISDRLANPPVKKDGSAGRPRARAWVPAIGSLLAAPLWAAFILADDPAVAALCLLGEYLTAECWFGPTLASLFSVVPKNRRGTAQGFFSVLTAAGNIAPVVVGAFAGGQLGSFALGDVLIGAVSGAYIVSGILFIFAAIEDEKRITLDWEKNKKA